MPQRPLAGRRVVTTREQRGALDTQLALAGADVINVPLITIEPPEDCDALDAACAALGSYDWLVVTSQHGARALGNAAGSHQSLRMAAVGRRTAAALGGAAGRPVDVVPSRQTAADLVEALRGQSGRVLVAQADRAAGTIVDGLQAAGFDVDAVTAYRTVLRSPSERERRAALAADAVGFASGSAVEAWSASIGAVTPPVAAAIGPTTAAVAKRVGLKITHVAADHDIDGLVAVITAALTRRP